MRHSDDVTPCVYPSLFLCVCVCVCVCVCQCRCQSLPQGAFEDLTPSMGYPTAGIILLPLLILTTAQMPPPSIWVSDTVNECAHSTPGALQAAPNLAPTLDRRLVCVCVCVCVCVGVSVCAYVR